MEEECGPFGWVDSYQEELKHSLMCTTLELETTIASARQQLATKEDELMHLNTLFTKAIKERDEAQAKCLILQQQQQLQASTLTSNIEDEPAGKVDSAATGVSDENFNTSQVRLEVARKLVMNKSLPEKGKFLQAVMEAGPLLQTLLLAGPLPQWQHPPPQLNSMEIPPAIISSPEPRLLHQDSCLSTSGCFSKKRGFVECEDFDFSPNAKSLKFSHQSSLTNI